MGFKLSLVKVIHKATKCGFNVHLLIHLWFTSRLKIQPDVHDELVVKSFVQERDKKFLTSGSKNFEDRILINEEEDIFIWGVVTYVIHSTY